MKTAFILALLCVSTFALQNTMQLQNNLAKLQNTGWGKIAGQFMELQIKLGGPLDELETAFRSLYADLQFQAQMEAKEWALKSNDHQVLAQSISERIHSANTDIAMSHHTVDNVLTPLKATLEGSIANDNGLHDRTVGDMNSETLSRAAAHQTYLEAVDEHEAAVDALLECIDLVSELKNSPSLIQITKTQSHLKKLQKHLSHRTEWAEMVNVMIQLAQNFSDQGNVGRVLTMLQDVLAEVHQSLANCHTDEADQLASFNAFMAIGQTTVDQALARIAENTAALARCEQDIQASLDWRAVRETDLGEANADDASETARWTKETDIHDTLVSELTDQQNAVVEIVTMVGNANVSETMQARLNQ